MSLTLQIAAGPPLRIAIVHVADRGGGAERSVLTLHKTLLELGHHSRLWVGDKRGDDPEVLRLPASGRSRGFSASRVVGRRRWLATLYAPWFRSLHEQIGSNVDVVHIHSLWNMRQGFADLTGVVRLARRYPTVMTLRDCWMLTGHCACFLRMPALENGLRQMPRSRHSARGAARHDGHQLAAQTAGYPALALASDGGFELAQGQVAQSPIFAGKPIDVVHNSIDESAFFPGSRQAARTALGVPQDAFVVLLAGQALEGADGKGKPRRLLRH